MCTYNLYSSEFDWEATPANSSTTGLPARELPEFTLPIGPTDGTKMETTPLQIFKLFVTVSVLELIVEQTPLYSVQQEAFFDFTFEDLFAFIGINIAMGMIRLPRVHDYWSTKPMLRMPWFSAIMPRNKFIKISRYLHVVD